MRLLLCFVICLLITNPLQASDLELVSGEVLIGVVIVERSAEVFVVEHPILGRLSIATSDIRTIDKKPINTIQLPTKMVPRVGAIDTSPPKPSPVTPESPKVDPGSSGLVEPHVPWQSQLEMGGNITNGATDTGNLVVRFRTSRTTPVNSTRVDMNYRLSTSNNERTVNRFDTGLFTEWNRDRSKWNTFAQGRYENAEFESWEQRITASGGLGYRLLDLKDVNDEGKTFDFLKLVGRIGSGIRYEVGSNNDGLAPEGLVGLDLDLRLSEDQRLVGITRYFPDLNESGEFRVESALDWTIDIDKLKGVSLRLGIQHEYDSQSAPDIPRNDVAAQATLVINF